MSILNLYKEVNNEIPDVIKFSEHQERKKEVREFLDRLHYIESKTSGVKTSIILDMEHKFQGKNLQGFAQLPKIKIPLPVIIALVEGWDGFSDWLQMNYGDVNGDVNTNFGWRVTKWVSIAIQALKLIVKVLKAR